MKCIYPFLYPELGVPISTFMVGGKVLISAAKLIISISVPKLQTTAYVSLLIVLEKKEENTFSYTVIYIYKFFILLGTIFNSLRNFLFLVKTSLPSSARRYFLFSFIFLLKQKNMLCNVYKSEICTNNYCKFSWTFLLLTYYKVH